MKKFLPIIGLLCCTVTGAQTIKGKVCMKSDKSPAQFASVGLAKLPDSSLVSGVITLTDGGYVFESVNPGEYFVKVSFMGYEMVEKKVSVVDNVAEFTVDTIYLTETATSLDEVTVVGQRLKGKELVDRTTYTIPPVVAKTSNNGYDILKRVPQVNVDFQNNITLNGSKNFIIQVDGRQRDKEFLARLLPSDIESIEVISNPSGKYEGNIDGVINIILKKEARYGVSGSAGLNIKPFNKLTYEGNASIDYSLGKITFYATAFQGEQNLYISSENRTHFPLLDSSTYGNGKGEISMRNSSINTGFDYYLNDKNSISVNYGYKRVGQYIDIYSLTHLAKEDVPSNSINSFTNNDVKSDESNVSLFYKKNFRKAVQEFTADLSYYNFNSHEDNDFVNKYHIYNDASVLDTFSRYEDNLNDREYFSAKLNYNHPLGINTKLETGYQAYYQKLTYDFDINNVNNENLFIYKELRNSVYGGITFNLKKFGFQTMLRLENSHINADSVSSPDYTCFLPSANVQYKFTANQNLKLTYNRRINRPGIYNMNPYWRIGQNYDISQGNPNLKPEYRDRLQLTYTWNFGSNYLSPNIYYERLSDKTGTKYLQMRSPIDSSVTTFSKPFNLLSGYEVGGGINAMLWYININARFFKGHYDAYSDQYYSIPEKDYYSYSITSFAYTSFGKDKKTTAFGFLNYNGVNVDAQTKTYNLAFWGLGLQKQIKDHSLGFVYVLPFYKDVELSKSVTETPVYNLTNTIGFDVSYYIQFMYSYKFNKGKNVKKVGHKVDVESDSKGKAIGM